MELLLKVKTLTPLWCGGADSHGLDRLHETGLIGSLRWWYEVILRGLGADICNPTSDSTKEHCPRDTGAYCDACRLFGAQGRASRFRLSLTGGTKLCVDGNIPFPSGRLHRDDRVGGWYLNGDSVVSRGRSFPLQLRVLSLVHNNELEVLRVPLALVNHQAALGAKTSNGYGVVEIQELVGDEFKPLVAEQGLERTLPSGDRLPHELPDLRHFFFAKFKLEEPADNLQWWLAIPGVSDAWSGEGITSAGNRRYFVYDRDQQKNTRLCNEAKVRLQYVVTRENILPLAPAVRNWLRFKWLPTTQYHNLEEQLFGRPGNKYVKAISSKVSVSYAYLRRAASWEFRIWGWLPLVMFDGDANRRQDFLNLLRKTLQDEETWKGALSTANAPSVVAKEHEWHDVSNAGGDGHLYLKQLLGLDKGVMP